MLAAQRVTEMKLRITAMFAVLVALGVTAWALYEKHQTEHTVLSMLYLDSATQIKNDLYILSSLREGRQKDAITHLERLLETKAAILEGCRHDLCADSMPSDFSEPLKSYAKYKEKYMKK